MIYSLKLNQFFRPAELVDVYVRKKSKFLNSKNLVREADRCHSTGINCTIPTTTRLPITSTTTQLPTTITTTLPSTTTARLTPPPKFNRFTAKPRQLPSWKKRPLDARPVNPPASRPRNDEDGSSISNQVEIGMSVNASNEYFESDNAVRVISSSFFFLFAVPLI
jgi:hypothetical protein